SQSGGAGLCSARPAEAAALPGPLPPERGLARLPGGGEGHHRHRNLRALARGGRAMTTHHHDHDHGHDHPHQHPTPPDHDDRPVPYHQRLEGAIRELLIEKGIVTPAEITRTVERMDARTPALGARVVAHAWSDPAYRQRLLTKASDAVAELGIEPGNFN